MNYDKSLERTAKKLLKLFRKHAPSTYDAINQGIINGFNKWRENASEDEDGRQETLEHKTDQ